MLESIFERRDEFLADFTIAVSTLLVRELGFASARFMRSSELLNLKEQKTDRVIDVLQRVGATHYICDPSASFYIEPEKFDKAEITFEYMQYNYPEYPRLHSSYDPYVTSLDLMFMMGTQADEFFSQRRSD